MKGAYYAAGRAWATLQTRRPVGRSIFDADWDICLVLDSTRLDMLRKTLPTFVPDAPAVRGVTSRGSITTEWLANTFRSDVAELEKTALVSATPHTQTVFRDKQWLTSPDAAPVVYPDAPAADPGDFAALHELWRSHATAENAVPPDVMLDATIEAFDRHERVVAHWMQPHEPFIAPDALLVGGDATERNVWQDLQAGRLNEGAVWQSYYANLHYALRHVARLTRAVDADILLTSDHGNAFGDWGVYGHPFGFPHPSVRRVPWVRLEGHATNPVATAGVLDETDAAAEDVDAQLRALGYR